MNVLLVFSSKYGATKNSSKIIKKVLQEEDLEVKLIDLSNQSIESIQEYDAILVGSGIKIGKWYREPILFLEKHNTELKSKKVALFVSAGSWPIEVSKGRKEKKEQAYELYLQKKAEKYSLNPISMGLFGGIINFKKMGWITKKTLGRVIKKGLKNSKFEEKDGIYDTRDIDKIKEWALETAHKIKNK